MAQNLDTDRFIPRHVASILSGPNNPAIILYFDTKDSSTEDKWKYIKLLVEKNEQSIACFLYEINELTLW